MSVIHNVPKLDHFCLKKCLFGRFKGYGMGRGWGVGVCYKNKEAGNDGMKKESQDDTRRYKTIQDGTRWYKMTEDDTSSPSSFFLRRG